MFESLHELWYRIRSRFNRDDLDAELAEELKTHAEFLEEEAIRGGASRDEARRAAADRLGNITNIREATRERWSFGWVEALLQDTKYAFRFLRRSPGFTAVAVLSLALGIGANATVFTVADKLLFSAPAHVANANRLHRINIKRVTEPGAEAPYNTGATFAEYFALYEQAKTLQDVVVYLGPSRVRMGRGPEAPRIKETLVSPNFFSVLGVAPIRGRFLLPDDDTPNRAVHAAVISYGFWQRQFAGAETAIGSEYNASNLRFVVVGIAPREFVGLEIEATDAWVPLAAAAPERVQPNWKAWIGAVPNVVVQVRDGILPATAAAEATVLLRKLPERRKTVIEETVVLGPLIQARGPSAQPAAVQVSTKLALASCVVLLAACANMANLLLARALARRREIALRLAIGVSRARLVSQILLESLIIAFCGAVAAMIIARWSGDALRKLIFPGFQWETAAVNVRVFTFALICGTIVAIIASIAPAIRMTRSDVSSALRSTAPQLTASTGRLRQGLLAFQVALSVVLIVGATVFTRSLNEAYSFDTGIDVGRIVTARVFVESDSMKSEDRLAMLEEGARAIRHIGGVEQATVSTSLPFTGNRMTSISDPTRPNSTTMTFRWDVTPDLLNTAGFRLVRGRAISASDVGPGTLSPILISETAAQKLWPNADPIGRCARIGADTSPCLPVIGVVRDMIPYSVRDNATVAVLVGVDKPNLTMLDAYIVVRTKPEAEASRLVSPIRLTLRDLRPDISSLEVRPLQQELEGDYRPLRMGSITIGAFAVLAIVLAAVGLYGLLAFNVAQRKSEFGIRSALGARASHIVSSVVREGMTVVLVGIVIGMTLSWYASTAIAALLFQSSARDAAPYAYALVVLGVVAFVASIVPALRASRVDPATALRAE